jgi:hypothetical protein
MAGPTIPRPAIRLSALGIAFNLNDAVVEYDHAIGKFRFAKAGARFDDIYCLAVDFQDGIDVIKIAVTPAPEVEVFDYAIGLDELDFACGYGCLAAVKSLCTYRPDR